MSKYFLKIAAPSWNTMCCASIWLVTSMLAVIPPNAHSASTITVTTTALIVDSSDGRCSLPEAILAAEQQATMNNCIVSDTGPYVIDLIPGKYNVTEAFFNSPILGNSAFFINGAGNRKLEINGNNAIIERMGSAPNMRIFFVNAGEFVLRNLTVRGGKLLAGEFGGGCILALQANVSLDRVFLDECEASSVGNAVAAIHDAQVNIFRSTIRATALQGASLRAEEYSVLNIANSTLSNLSGGGAISVVGFGAEANISSSTIVGKHEMSLVEVLDNGMMRARKNIFGEGTCGGSGTLLFLAENYGCNQQIAPQLMPLSNYGGPLSTHLIKLPALAANSAGHCEYLNSNIQFHVNPLFTDSEIATIDQRGRTRNQSCDAGAVESFNMPSSLPSAVVGTNYFESVNITDGAPPYVFSVSSGLPPGLELATNGAFSGQASAPGEYTFDISVTDSLGMMTTQTYVIQVLAQPDLVPDSFSFPSLSNVSTQTLITSTPQKITGLSSGWAAFTWLSGSGEYCLNSMAACPATCDLFNWTRDNSIAVNGDYICTRHTSAATASMTVITTVSVGENAMLNKSASFQTTTAAPEVTLISVKSRKPHS